MMPSIPNTTRGSESESTFYWTEGHLRGPAALNHASGLQAIKAAQVGGPQSER